MISNDLIIYICNFLINKNYYFINKYINNIVIYQEKNINSIWKLKYDNFLIKNKKKFLILNNNNYKYNWKREYLRIKNDIVIKNINIYEYGVTKYVILNNLKIKKIPKEIGSLYNITDLNLTNNQIIFIPKEIKYLVNLEYIDLSNNCIELIPKEIGKLIKLQSFRIDNNLIQKLPLEITKLINLRYLSIINNKINKIPKELYNNPNIRILNF